MRLRSQLMHYNVNFSDTELIVEPVAHARPEATRETLNRHFGKSCAGRFKRGKKTYVQIEHIGSSICADGLLEVVAPQVAPLGCGKALADARKRLTEQGNSKR